jgi:hypothetical protein
VLPPWGTIGVPVSFASMRIAETYLVEPGLSTAAA